MTVPRSDAQVLFGVTGDLPHKMIFPALYPTILAWRTRVLFTKRPAGCAT